MQAYLQATARLQRMTMCTELGRQIGRLPWPHFLPSTRSELTEDQTFFLLSSLDSTTLVGIMAELSLSLSACI